MGICILILAFLFLPQEVVAQTAETPSPSSGNQQDERTQSGNPSAPGIVKPSGHCPDLAKQPRIPRGKVSSGRLIRRVNPDYPAALRKARIEGTVLLCATIGTDGKLHNLLAFSGPPELIPYAKKAVEQWRYEPYRVDKKPVDVDSEIRVDFKLHP
jgi:TonB family protein